METVMKLIEDAIASDQFDVYGLRVIDGPVPAIGETLPVSLAWDDGICTGEELDGTSAIEIRGSGERAARLANDYFGATIAIIGGNAYTHGEDDGEIVIRDAVVIATHSR